jgi:hypothetical protein
VPHSGSWACVTSRQVKAKADETASGMGVWHPGIGLQGLVPNHLVLLRSKDMVVSDGETADWIRQVYDEKVSVSEPLMTRRYLLQTLPKREAAHTSRISVDATCLRTHGSRRIDGTSSSQALMRNVRTCHGMPREHPKWSPP